LLASVVVAASLGVTQLAAFQIAFTVFTALALALDALAIAGQALVGHGLGASDVERVHAVTRRLIRWGIGSGVVLGVLLAAVSPSAGAVFSPSPAVQQAVGAVLLVMAVGIPLGGYVFVLDGVLIGAGDARYLALAGLVNLAVYAPLLAAVALVRPPGVLGLVCLWAAFGFGYLGARALTLGLRARGSRWIVTGAPAAS
ncbi:MAG: MATE family efflux transporter, partial [Herbiconiux sp.]|nr:MATE family efflux transporter [Herbiconiux sp.]